MMFFDDDYTLKEVVRIKPFDDYQILVTFDNGEERVFNGLNLLSNPVFSFLKDRDCFMAAYVEEGAITWNTPSGNKVDICPDKTYAESYPI